MMRNQIAAQFYVTWVSHGVPQSQAAAAVTERP